MSKNAGCLLGAKEWACLVLHVTDHLTNLLLSQCEESLHFMPRVFDDSHRIKDKYSGKEVTQSVQMDDRGSDMGLEVCSPCKNFKIRATARGQ